LVRPFLATPSGLALVLILLILEGAFLDLMPPPAFILDIIPPPAAIFAYSILLLAKAGFSLPVVGSVFMGILSFTPPPA
jgi:hypothetical protein